MAVPVAPFTVVVLARLPSSPKAMVIGAAFEIADAEELSQLAVLLMSPVRLTPEPASSTCSIVVAAPAPNAERKVTVSPDALGVIVRVTGDLPSALCCAFRDTEMI